MRGRRQQQEELERRLAAAQHRIAELENELELLAVRDPLTGLANLQAFGRRLDAEVERSRRHGASLTAATLDVDGFRQMNRSHGREVGDRVLQAVGHTLTRFTRASDLVSRTRSDEFAVMLPEATVAEALKCFERLMLELEVLRVGPVESVSVSVGVAQYRPPNSSGELMAAAAERLAQARAAGGGRIEAAAGSDDASEEGPDRQHEAVAALAEALVERDRYTGEHSESVVDLVVSVARALALDEHEVDQVRAAALLHDIGKVGIPDDILHKPGPLDDREWAVMREHPAIGERILRAIPGLGGVARIVRHEHERYDGTGYPDRLRGDEIPIGARIILACDAYHAMTSDRPYRKGMSHAEAVRQLAEGAGSQFDPEVTQVLIGCLYGGRQQAPAAA